MRRGQALVVVLMILAVVSAVGLSIVSRSVTEVNLSSIQDEGSQALSAVEAGVETILANPNTPLNTPAPIGGGTYTIVTKTAENQQSEIVLGELLLSGEPVTLFLKGTDASGNFTGANYGNNSFKLCWGKTGQIVSGQEPSLGVTMYYQNSSTLAYGVSVGGFNPVSRSNGFKNSGIQTGGNQANCNSSEYEYYTNANFPSDLNLPAGNNPLFVRIQLSYNTSSGQPVKVVSSSGQFPVQGFTSEVEGKSGSTVKRVRVVERYPDPLSVFDNAIFSGGAL